MNFVCEIIDINSYHFERKERKREFLVCDTFKHIPKSQSMNTSIIFSEENFSFFENIHVLKKIIITVTLAAV